MTGLPVSDRSQLLHVARAACRVVGVRRLLVVGSQAILGAVDPAQLPEGLPISAEVDVIVVDDLDGDAHLQVEGVLGEMSQFHSTFGYCAEGLQLSQVVLPDGWEGRMCHLDVPDVVAVGDDIRVLVPQPEDLCVSKLVAFRDKDRLFVRMLLAAGLVEADVLIGRLKSLEGRVAQPVVDRAVQFVATSDVPDGEGSS